MMQLVCEPVGGEISGALDWLAAGGTIEQLVAGYRRCVSRLAIAEAVTLRNRR